MEKNINILAIDTIIESLNLLKLDNILITRGSYISRFYLGNYPRKCQDLDFLCLKKLDLNTIKQYIFDILDNIKKGTIYFDKNDIIFEDIWVGSLSPGVRVIINFFYENKKYPLQIDIASGDPLVQKTIKVLVNKEKNLYSNSVPLETLAAWKLHGLFELITGIWYPKTLWDFYLMCKHNKFNIDIFKEAVKIAFESRFDPIEILKRFLYGDFGKSYTTKKHWLDEINKLSYGNSVELDIVLKELKEFLIPILDIKDDKTLLNKDEVFEYRIKKLEELKINKNLFNSKIFHEKDSINFKIVSLNKKNAILNGKLSYIIYSLNDSSGNNIRKIDYNKKDLLLDNKRNKDDIVIVYENISDILTYIYKKENKLYILDEKLNLIDENSDKNLQLYLNWVKNNKESFFSILENEEKVLGFWSYLTNNSNFNINELCFTPTELFNDKNKALSFSILEKKLKNTIFKLPKIIHKGLPCSIEKAKNILEELENELKNDYNKILTKNKKLMWRLDRNDYSLFRAEYNLG
ncbi:MAG: hypothetical protein U0457_13390 [Candidatus Sericytochromatia bacterium]